MSDQIDNLYRPPASSLDAFEEGGGGIWRRKRLLVMQEDAILPHRCYLCADTPAVASRTLRARWSHPWIVVPVVAMIFVPVVGWLLFLAALAFVAVMGIRRNTRIEYSLCARHHRRQTIAAVVAVVMIAASLLLSMAVLRDWGVVLGGQAKQGLLVLAGVTLLLGGLVGIIGRSMRRPTVRRYTTDLVWLTGFGRPFLELFEEYRERER